MTWGLTAVAAATVYSASKSSSAASRAAETQAQAAEQGTAAQERMFERQVQLQEPWRQSGIAAQNRLLTLLGINPNVAAAGGGGGGGFGIAGAISDQIARAGAGTTAPGLTVDTTSPDFGKYAKEFGMTQFTADPGYAFRLSEGQKALERSAAARGGLLSGAAGKALTRYGQEMGSQEYQNAFNRYQAERAAQLNPLQSLAGVGQTSANTLTSAAGTMGQNIAEGIGSAAAARASGYVGGANAINQAVGQGINLYGLYNQNQLYNRMFPQVPTNTYPGVDATSVMG